MLAGYASKPDVNEDEDEDEDKHKHDSSIPTEPSLSLFYDCVTRTVNVYMEWVGGSIDCTMASISIDFSKMDWENYSWEWHNNDILSTTEKLQSNKNRLANFNETLSKIALRYIKMNYLFSCILEFVQDKIFAAGISLCFRIFIIFL